MSTNLRKLDECETRINQLASFLEMGPQVIDPQRGLEGNGMHQEGMCYLVGNALNTVPACPYQMEIQGKTYDEITAGNYNARVFVRMQELEEEKHEFAGRFLQALIRGVNTRFVNKVIQTKRISSPPKIKRGFLCCVPKPIDLPVVDYSSYFCESDWIRITQKDTMNRSDLLLLVQTLQLQLCDVEERLTNSNKVSKLNEF